MAKLATKKENRMKLLLELMINVDEKKVSFTLIFYLYILLCNFS